MKSTEYLFAETETDLEVPFHRETVLPPSGQLRRVPPFVNFPLGSTISSVR